MLLFLLAEKNVYQRKGLESDKNMLMLRQIHQQRTKIQCDLQIKNEWKIAIEHELKALKENDACNMVEQKTYIKVIETK